MKKRGNRNNNGTGILLVLVLVVNLLIIFGFALEARMAHRKMEELVGQISYLSDTTSILRSDVGNLRQEMLENLKASESLLEGWDITLRSMNFADNTYTVDVQIIPKEYTDTMEISIYFGTKGLKLSKDDFRYSGSAELSLEESYDNNVAVLLADGESRKTEVIYDYHDVRTDLTNVLYGTLSEAPVYEDGSLQINGTGYVRLDAGEFFRFQGLKLLVAQDDHVLSQYDLAAMSRGEQPSEEEEETSVDITMEDHLLTGLTYSFMLAEEIPTEEEGHVRLYLQVESDKGYIFAYELVSFDLERLEPEQLDPDQIEVELATESETAETADGAQADENAKPLQLLQIREGSMIFSGKAVVYDPQGHAFDIQ